MQDIKKIYTFAIANAKIAQLVEHNLAKVRVAGSSPVFRSNGFARMVESVDTKDLKSFGYNTAVRVQVPLRVPRKKVLVFSKNLFSVYSGYLPIELSRIPLVFDLQPTLYIFHIIYSGQK